MRNSAIYCNLYLLIIFLTFCLSFIHIKELKNVLKAQRCTYTSFELRLLFHKIIIELYFLIINMQRVRKCKLKKKAGESLWWQKRIYIKNVAFTREHLIAHCKIYFLNWSLSFCFQNDGTHLRVEKRYWAVYEYCFVPPFF